MLENHPSTWRLPQFDGLRAIAVLIIVWAPLGTHNSIEALPGTDLGFAGV